MSVCSFSQRGTSSQLRSVNFCAASARRPLLPAWKIRTPRTHDIQLEKIDSATLEGLDQAKIAAEESLALEDCHLILMFWSLWCNCHRKNHLIGKDPVKRLIPEVNCCLSRENRSTTVKSSNSKSYDLHRGFKPWCDLHRPEALKVSVPQEILLQIRSLRWLYGIGEWNCWGRISSTFKTKWIDHVGCMNGQRVFMNLYSVYSINLCTLHKGKTYRFCNMLSKQCTTYAYTCENKSYQI